MNGNPGIGEREPKKGNRDALNVTPEICEEEMVLPEISKDSHSQRHERSQMLETWKAMSKDAQDGLIVEKLTKTIIATAPGKYLQISYGLYLDFVIWRNLRQIGLPYPLFRWILFWLKCFGGL